MGAPVRFTVLETIQGRAPQKVVQQTEDAPCPGMMVEGGRYLVNDTFSAADIMMGYTLFLAKRFGVLTPDGYPNANAYYARLEPRPGFVKARG